MHVLIEIKMCMWLFNADNEKGTQMQLAKLQLAMHQVSCLQTSHLHKLHRSPHGQSGLGLSPFCEEADDAGAGSRGNSDDSLRHSPLKSYKQDRKRTHVTKVFACLTLFPPLGRDDPAPPHPSINPPAKRKEVPASDVWCCTHLLGTGVV